MFCALPQDSDHIVCISYLGLCTSDFAHQQRPGRSLNAAPPSKNSAIIDLSVGGEGQHYKPLISL